jgi:hypothetical protein
MCPTNGRQTTRDRKSSPRRAKNSPDKSNREICTFQEIKYHLPLPSLYVTSAKEAGNILKF